MVIEIKANVKVVGHKNRVSIGADSLDYFNPKAFLQFTKEPARRSSPPLK